MKYLLLQPDDRKGVARDFNLTDDQLNACVDGVLEGLSPDARLLLTRYLTLRHSEIAGSTRAVGFRH